MKESARYAKIVEWSEEDQCYVGSSPGLIYGGCHGFDDKMVFDELCQVVVESYHSLPLRRQTASAVYIRTRLCQQNTRRRVTSNGTRASMWSPNVEWPNSTTETNADTQRGLLPKRQVGTSV